MVDCADIGAIVAAALIDSSYEGRTLTLTGPRAYTFQDIADAIAAAGGPSALAVPVAIDDAVAGLRVQGHEWAAEHLAAMLRLFREGQSEFVTDDVAEVLGRPPRDIGDYLKTQTAALAAVADAAPGTP